MNKNCCFLLTFCLLNLKFFTSFLVAQGGPLAPPGPPGVTMKTLDEVEPRIPLIEGADGITSDSESDLVITQPGSYYFTAGISASGTYAIKVTVPGVTIDLSGYELSASDADAFAGIFTHGVGTVIKNGFISGFYHAIYAPSFDCGTISDVTVRNCLDSAVYVNNEWTLTNVKAYGGGTSADQTIAGIEVGSNCKITGCLASDNDKNGFRIGIGTLITNSAASSNGLKGIDYRASCLITNCTANSNGTDGFGGLSFLAGASQLTRFKNCVASGNAQNGFQGGRDCILKDCTAVNNTKSGFYFNSGGSFIDCSANKNVENGISIGDFCILKGNHCSSNSISGILVTGDNNRIEGNHLTDNSTHGLKVEGGDNIIIRNSVMVDTDGTVYDGLDRSVAGGNRQGLWIHSGVGSNPTDNFTNLYIIQ